MVVSSTDAATSDCADSRRHSAQSTPPLSTAAVVLMEALSPLRCAALVLLCLTTPTLLAPPSCSRQDCRCYNDKSDIYKNRQTSSGTTPTHTVKITPTVQFKHKYTNT